MSVLSTLALLMLPGALKAKVVADPEQEDLKRALADRDAEIVELKRERDRWRDLANPIALGGQHAAQSQQNAALLQQYAQATQCQQQMMGLQNYQQGLLGGAQALNPEMFCNCVPSRSQVWAVHENGD
jgi:hypothetical protein